MNTWDKCKNCGGERGLHHYETDQCPVGGREAPIGRKQEWKSTTFEIDEPDKDARIAELEATARELLQEWNKPYPLQSKKIAEGDPNHWDAERWNSIMEKLVELMK